MTFDPDRPDAHVKPQGQKSPTPSMVRLGWRKMSDYGIESLCGRFRIGRYTVGNAVQFALWDGFTAAWRGSNPDDARRVASKFWKPA